MKENMFMFIVSFIVIASTFATYTGLSIIQSGDQPTTIQDNETDAFEVLNTITNMGVNPESGLSDFLAPVITIFIIAVIIIIVLIIRGS